MRAVSPLRRDFPRGEEARCRVVSLVSHRGEEEKVSVLGGVIAFFAHLDKMDEQVR